MRGGWRLYDLLRWDGMGYRRIIGASTALHGTETVIPIPYNLLGFFWTGDVAILEKGMPTVNRDRMIHAANEPASRTRSVRFRGLSSFETLSTGRWRCSNGLCGRNTNTEGRGKCGLRMSMIGSITLASLGYIDLR